MNPFANPVRDQLRAPRALNQILLIGLGAAMLMWSAVVNGRPAVFADTALYYSQAEYLAEALDLVPPGATRVPPGDPTALPRRPGAPNVSATIDGARSPIYGLFIYSLERLGGLWLVAAVQSFLVALTLHMLFRAAAPRLDARWYAMWMALISAVTSAPFFSSFIMPDVFGGVVGAASLMMLVYWERLETPARLGAFALLVFGLSVHRANLLVAGGLDGVAGAFFVLTRRRSRAVLEPVAALAVAVAVAWGLLAVAALPIARRAGEPIRNPPFLMARVLADGPGWRYLQHACAQGRPLALCRFRGLPREDSDTLLWSNRRVNGLFGVSDFATRLRLETQERSFVLGALAYDPLGQLRASTANIAQQLMMTHVQSPLADPARYVGDGYWRRTALVRIIPSAVACRVRGRCASKVPAAALETVQDVAIGLSVLALAAWPLAVRLKLRNSVGPGDDLGRMSDLALLALAFVLVNAVVCGVLSAPVSRYQARLIWLLPAAAFLIPAALRGGSRITAPWGWSKIVKTFNSLTFLQHT